MAQSKLLVLASTYPRWSDDREPGFVHQLCKRLGSRFDLTVLCPHAPGALQTEVMDGVRVIRYRYAPEALQTLVQSGGILANLQRSPWKFVLLPGFLLGQLFALRRLLKDWQPDVVQAHWLIPQGLSIAILDSIPGCSVPPFLVTAHGGDLFALQGAPLKKLKAWVTGRASFVTVVSPAMSDKLQELGVAQEKIEVQPMGVDLRERFCPDRTTERASGEILFVGRLVEKKGLAYLLEAMPAILAAYPEVRLKVAGFGPLETQLRKRVDQLAVQSRVDFLGAVDQGNLPSLYRSASLVVAPFVVAASGDQEGLGLVALEALGCGCPLVVSEIPATREIRALSPAVLGVPPGDSSAIAEAVVKILQSPAQYREDIAALREELLAKYDWQHTAESYRARLAALQADAGKHS